MASSSGKRIKTMGQKRKEPERVYSNKFLSYLNEQHFGMVQNRRLLMERKVGMIPAMALQFGRELERREWENVASYPTLANIVVVKEFYANARVFGNNQREAYTGYVRGKIIQYDSVTINRFLSTEWAGEQCQFALIMEEGANYDEIERILCVPGGCFQRNMNESPIHIRRAVNTKAPLGHPSLITHLWELAGVNTSTPPMEQLRKEIDASYYTHYCMLNEAGQPMPPPQNPRVHRRAPPPE
ncbi:hypothetical protein LR48_Vigan221s002200 [Vigna angularis]|uniref:Putative plant transposon protein domain-containing protein n=1 Tax=Phaseolus angularis TaxID=3914 RepID=A0A0L9T642_PHAAN|nr:hypothetical protein LR48_Vigan221s002200 [Vigna angularis]